MMGMGKHRWFILYTLLYIWMSGLRAAVPDDSMRISLLTCSPGEQIYAHYGHTALRVSRGMRGGDWIFNFGVFSFEEPHFLWRFIKGDCRYMLWAMPYDLFYKDYEAQGLTIYEQKLNLTLGERHRLWEALKENARPENRAYLYNFFYDNCATRVRDRLEDALEGKPEYPPQPEPSTFRQITRRFTADYPWAGLGNDLCLGAEADREIGARQEMFAPYYLMYYVSGAVVRDSCGHVRRLAESPVVVLRGGAQSAGKCLLTPAVVAWSLVAIVLLLSWWEWRNGWCFWVIDVLAGLLVGGIGVVITFLMFFSIHPAVHANWQLWVFNPVQLLAMPWVVWCGIKRRRTSWHKWNAAFLTLFLIFSTIIPQEFSAIVVPLAIILIIRSCKYMLSYRERE